MGGGRERKGGGGRGSLYGAKSKIQKKSPAGLEILKKNHHHNKHVFAERAIYKIKHYSHNVHQCLEIQK